MNDLISWIIIGLLLIVGLVFSLIIISFFSTWLKAYLARAPVSFATLLAMRLRGVPVGLIVDARVTAVKANIPLDTDQLEAHYLADGNVVQTVQSLIAASKASIDSPGIVLVRLILLLVERVSLYWKQFVPQLILKLLIVKSRVVTPLMV